MEKKEFRDILLNGLNDINVTINENKIDLFYDYMNLILFWNEKINLTAIIDKKDIIMKHFIDCISINKYIEDGSIVMDMGTGAGFPGIPLKIINDRTKFILVDSLNKRINFLKEVKKELKLENLDLIHSRAEDLAKDKNYREKMNVVVSRAVANLQVLAEYMLPFVKIGGKCICMKGPNIEEEIENSKKAIEILGGKIDKIDHILLDNNKMERNIIIIKKIKETPSKYPRKAGLPVKQPL